MSSFSPTRRGVAHSGLGEFLGTKDRKERNYVTYLLVIAVLGWALAAYDFNLLVVALPAIAIDLQLSSIQVGLMAFVIYGAMLVISLAVGYGMDARGRKWMWMLALTGAAIFTGLTFFVQNYWQLVAVRALASGLANAELAISITLVNEQVPAHRRGLLYSFVQGGWPLGVLLAATVWYFAHPLGWHVVFLFGVIPLVIVIVGRRWVRESDRYLHVKEIKAAKKAGDGAKAKELLKRYEVNLDEVEQSTVRQLFGEGGWVTSQLIKLSIVWLLYSGAFVATNVYIVYWMTKFRGFTAPEATLTLLAAAGIGFFFYLIGGALGERFGRQRILIASAVAAVILNTLFFFLHSLLALVVVYILIYQATNGTWSGVGYAYWAESFPTRVRGSAVGWLGAMFTAGLILGSGVWTLLIGFAGPAVTWFVIAVAFACGQLVATLFLPNIKSGQALESIAS